MAKEEKRDRYLWGLYPKPGDVAVIEAFRKGLLSRSENEADVLMVWIRQYVAENQEALKTERLFTSGEITDLVREYFDLELDRRHLSYFRSAMDFGTQYFGVGRGAKMAYTYKLHAIWPRILKWAKGRGKEITEELKRVPEDLCGPASKPKRVSVAKPNEPETIENVKPLGDHVGWDLSQIK